MTKTTTFSLLRSNGHTEIRVAWSPEGTVLKVSTLEGDVEMELTPFETQQLQAAMLPDESFTDPARVRVSHIIAED